MDARSSKAHEVWEELRLVVLARGGIVDAFAPPVVFLVVRALAGDQPAMAAALMAGGSLALFRAVRRQSAVFAVLGLSGSALALLAGRLLQRAELFFLPEIITNIALAVAAVASTALRRPLVAWTSHFVRRWPRDWYWHARVLPAYTEVTLIWAGFFLLQASLQWFLLGQHDVALIAASSLLNGWPATVLLLILSYLYGSWRLQWLHGPSVAEFQDGTPPPWRSQRRGF